MHNSHDSPGLLVLVVRWASTAQTMGGLRLASFWFRHDLVSQTSNCCATLQTSLLKERNICWHLACIDTCFFRKVLVLLILRFHVACVGVPFKCFGSNKNIISELFRRPILSDVIIVVLMQQLRQ